MLKCVILLPTIPGWISSATVSIDILGLLNVCLNAGIEPSDKFFLGGEWREQTIPAQFDSGSFFSQLLITYVRLCVIKVVIQNQKRNDLIMSMMKKVSIFGGSGISSLISANTQIQIKTQIQTQMQIQIQRYEAFVHLWWLGDLVAHLGKWLPLILTASSHTINNVQHAWHHNFSL